MFMLQISCIIIVMFLFTLFMMERDFKRESQKLFSVILVVSVLQIVFEMLIIYTIHSIEAFSPVMFKTIHRSYLTLVLTQFYLHFRYMSSFICEETGEPAKSLAFIHTAQIILYFGMFLLPLGYVKEGDVARFSHGQGVWVVYIGVVFYMFVIFSNYCGQSRRIAKQKIVPLILGVGCAMCCCFCYMCIPSIYVTCLGVAIMDMAIYLSLRDSEKVEADDGRLDTAEQAEVTLVDKVLFEAPQARVLVVDDSEMNRKLFCNLLKATKVQVEEAAGGKECLELVRNNEYHIIFMDHLMPEMDGLETFDIIRRQHLCDHVPIVAMTANTVSMTEEDYLKYGFAGFIIKPIVPEKVSVTMYRLLEPSLVTVIEKSTVTEKSLSVEEQTEQNVCDKDGTEQDWNNLPPVDGLDYHYASLHFQTVEEFEEMVHFLVAVMKPDAQEIENYFMTLDDAEILKNFQTKVHSMKNSAMTIGVVPLAGLAKTLEDAAREEREEQIRALMPVFMEKWEKYRIMLQEVYAVGEKEKVSADPQSQEIKTLFEKLREAAGDMDIDELDRIMEEIDGYEFAPEYNEKVEKIRLAVMNFDVEYLQEEGYL